MDLGWEGDDCQFAASEHLARSASGQGVEIGWQVTARERELVQFDREETPKLCDQALPAGAGESGNAMKPLLSELNNRFAKIAVRKGYITETALSVARRRVGRARQECGCAKTLANELFELQLLNSKQIESVFEDMFVSKSEEDSR